MSKIGYRIILEKDGKKIILLDQEINKPKNLFELGVNYEDQLNLIKGLPVVHTKKKKKLMLVARSLSFSLSLFLSLSLLFFFLSLFLLHYFPILSFSFQPHYHSYDL